MSDEVTRQAAELSAQKEDTKTAHVVGQQLLGQVIQERDDWRAEVTRLNDAGTGLIIQLNVALADVERLTEERDAVQADLQQAEQNNQGLYIELQNMRADSNTLTMERDRAQSHLQSMIRKADHLVAERDAAQDETHKLREQYAKLHAENEGMRADALARPPEYDRTLAIERKRHSKLLDDYNLQATMIETLQEGLKRTELMLAKAQAQHIDDRLKGFLSVISQLADQAQDLLP